MEYGLVFLNSTSCQAYWTHIPEGRFGDSDGGSDNCEWYRPIVFNCARSLVAYSCIFREFPAPMISLLDGSTKIMSIPVICTYEAQLAAYSPNLQLVR